MPSLELVCVATRFQLPCRTVAYSPSGASLAAAGDENGIKLINVEDTKVCFSLLPMQDCSCLQTLRGRLSKLISELLHSAFPRAQSALGTQHHVGIPDPAGPSLYTLVGIRPREPVCGLRVC